ncbi:MAG: MBL fold metallo-hydrolase, partial [Nanoarchaeota archaeon]
ILKVGHHGSKYSSGKKFLNAVNPKISAIEVGKNSYGHPTLQALNELASIGSRIFRTDQNGTIKLVINGDKINIFQKK